MKKFFAIFALLLALVLSCAACVKTDIPTPNATGEEINGEQLVEFYERIKATQTENEHTIVDSWFVITLEEVNHTIYADEDEDKMHGTASIDFYNPANSSDLKFRSTATTMVSQTVNGEAQPTQTSHGMTVAINGVAYAETSNISLTEESISNRYTHDPQEIYIVFVNFSTITLESVASNFSTITQTAYLKTTESVEVLTVVYNYEDADKKIEQTVIFEYDAATANFISFTVHACTQTVSPSDAGDDYNTKIVKFTCTRSIPLPIFEPNLESGDWANQN